MCDIARTMQKITRWRINGSEKGKIREKKIWQLQNDISKNLSQDLIWFLCLMVYQPSWII